ncbi:MAG: LysM peptidoglycan-binding domain-containing protein [Anaerovoracaceae bacterium]|jgi:LysM repeat protein
MKKHYKIVSIPRFTIFVITCTLAVTLIAVFAVSSFRAAAESEPVYRNITVEQGDSLWTIAEDQYGSGTDIRKAVYEIRQANDLTDASLYEGQVLKIPESI